jgi:hypothetical protein
VKVSSAALRWLLARTSRYTRTVSWRHRISLVVLIVLTAFPVSGMGCAMLCGSAATTRGAAHHGSAKSCDDEQATAPSSGSQVRGTSAHDCSNHDAVVPIAATTSATRADSVPGPSLLAAVPLHDSFSNRSDSDVVMSNRTPPGSTPPTASPLVLRV